LILGCDGVFDKLNTQETVDIAWKAANDNIGLQNVHQIAGRMADAVLVKSAESRSLDNLSVVVIIFQPFIKKMGLEKRHETPIAKSLKLSQI